MRWNQRHLNAVKNQRRANALESETRECDKNISRFVKVSREKSSSQSAASMCDVTCSKARPFTFQALCVWGGRGGVVGLVR